MTAVFYKGDRSGSGFFRRAPQHRLDRTALAELVQRVVQDADWSRPSEEGWTGRARTTRTEIMLAVLTYCYALGLYGASEIDSALASGLIKGGVVDGTALDRFALIRFRRYNRDLLRSCLTQVLERLLAPSEGRAETGTALRAQAATQAEERIDRAVEWDCLERDE